MNAPLTGCEEWSAQAEADVAAFIRSYLEEHPAPDRCRVAEDLEEMVGLLQDDAGVRFAAARRLANRREEAAR